jgi:hypothetical protein
MRANWLASLALFFAAASGDAMAASPESALGSLLAERKFQPNEWYTGVDTPEDQAPLEDFVNDAIRDVADLPSPVDPAAVRARLEQLIQDVDFFATEDREMAYRYVVRIWRATGLQEESRLFPVSDDRVLRPY